MDQLEKLTQVLPEVTIRARREIFPPEPQASREAERQAQIMPLRQRTPRQSDEPYLKWLRTQRCACGCLQGPPCDAAHLRASSAVYDKASGVGQKPDDRWALPFTHVVSHGAALPRQRDELVGEAPRFNDPFALCIMYYLKFQRSKLK